MVHAAGRWAGGVEERDGPWLDRVLDVEDLEPRRLHAGRLRLISDDHEVADDVERVGAHLVVRQVRLRDHGELARVGDVHRRHILGRRFVGDPEHATAIPRELDGHALAAVAEAVERVLREEPHVP